VPARFRWDAFVLDLDAYRLERGGLPVSLEPKAFDLLALMVQRPGHLFSKQEIFDAVWPGTAVTDHALTRVVAQIRRALGDEAREARYLETVPTKGYRWICRVESIDAAAVPPEPVTPPPDQPALVTGARSLSVAATVATALVIGGALLTWAWSSSRAAATVEPARGPATPASEHDVEWPTQLTTHAGLDMHPALSPHGDAVAFVSDRSGAFEIHVRVLDGSATESPLTSDQGQNVQPAWSPDGKFLAYHSYRRGGIWIVPARGGTPRQIVEEGSSPAWSPDGTSIAYQSDEHADASPTGFGAQAGSTIRLVDVASLRQTALTESGSPWGGHASPAWSPDGRFITFSVFEGRPGGLWVLDRRSGAVSLLRRADKLYESVFSRDGSTIYAAGGDAFIVRLPFDAATGSAGEAHMIPVPGVPGVRDLSLSHDGSTLAFAGLDLDSQIWVQPVAPGGTPTGRARALTSGTSRRNSLPVVSPGGTHVAYMSSRRGQPPNVWVMNIDGTGAQQLTPDSTAEYWPEWLPDGRRVAFLSRRGEQEGLWSVDITTRMETLLFDMAALPRSQLGPIAEGGLAELRFSPSMSSVALAVFVPPAGRRALFVTAFEPVAFRAVGQQAYSPGYPAWSPDERAIAVEIKDGSSTHAGIVDVETGSVRQVTRERGQTWVRSWSADGRAIAAAVLREGVWSLRAIDAANGRETVLTPPERPGVYVRYPDWSRRGDTVVFERAEMTGNIWQLRIR
jgi:Tol biopolymer transport system component/DNA-binding winged helix-turn-helix (wHTH) protein